MPNINIRPIEAQAIRFGVIGISPLIYHAWHADTKAGLMMTPMERRKQPKTKRDPAKEAEAANWRLPNGKPAFPLIALKAAMIQAAHKDFGLEKTALRKSFFLPGSAPCLVELIADEPVIRQDIVRIGKGVTDIRHRPEYWPWRVIVEANIDTSIINIGDVINLVKRAGFGVGVGEWRPERGGEMGRFTVDKTIDVKCEVIKI